MKKDFIVGLVTGLIITSASLVLANSQIQAILNDEVKISLNGQIQTFTDETTGEVQYPITYNNRTYLPLRNVATLVGLSVGYDQERNMVELDDISNESSGASIKDFIEITNSFKEIPDGEVLKFSKRLKNNKRFAIKTNSNFYNYCRVEDNHIIIGNKYSEDSTRVTKLDLSLEESNFFDELGGFPYSNLDKLSAIFDFEIFRFEATKKSDYVPQIIILKYEDYYTIMEVESGNGNVDARYVVNSNKLANFIAFVINNNKEIDVIVENEDFFKNQKNKVAKFVEKENYKNKIHEEFERVYTIDIEIDGKTYKIPQINVDNINMPKTNENIVEDVKNVINSSSYDNIKIDYNYYLYNDIMSVVIKVNSPEKGLKCYVYNIVMIGGNVLTNHGLVSFNGSMVEDDFLQEIQNCKDKLASLFGEYNYFYKAEPINEKFGILMFFNSEGKLNLIVRDPISDRYIYSTMLDEWISKGISNI